MIHCLRITKQVFGMSVEWRPHWQINDNLHKKPSYLSFLHRKDVLKNEESFYASVTQC